MLIFFFLKIAGKAQCCFDVVGLSAFIPASKEKHYFWAVLGEIHPITGAAVNPQFVNAFANRFNITGISLCQPPEPNKNPSTRLNIAQIVNPLGKYFCFAEFHLSFIVASFAA